ncbi:hypothetical protein HDV05_001287 [Chytridiales sp. JEL 0842]|nr:hypothetical protein HDV05_001287 [Chytridiales sp. JEL 0842]
MPPPTPATFIRPAPLPSHILQTYRSLLREIQKQYTRPNQNPLWKTTLITRYRTSLTLQDPHLVQKLHWNAVDLLSFLKATREHQRLMDEYFPVSQLSASEKVERTAGVVGLNMPRPLEAYETAQGGGKTWTQLRQEESQTGLEGLERLEEAVRILEGAGQQVGGGGSGAKEGK